MNIIDKFDCGNVGAILGVKRKVDIVGEQELHEAIFFLHRQITEHKRLRISFNFFVVLVLVVKFSEAQARSELLLILIFCLLLTHLGRIVVIALITIVNLIC